MTDFNDIATICQQAEIDSRFKKRLSDKLQENGFIPVGHYFKRVQKERAEYVFVDRIADKSPSDLELAKVSGSLKGTFYISMPNQDAYRFEKAVHTSQKDVPGNLITGTCIGCGIGWIPGILYFTHNFDFLPMLIGGFVGGMGSAIYTEIKVNKAIRTLDKEFLPNCRHSENAFDHAVLQYALETKKE